MTTRKRLTWAAGTKKASPPPAVPGYDEAGKEHPASQPDPEANAYENGDTSSWAEDPHPGPYVNSAPPAVPGYDEAGKEHPAAKQASLRVAVERKAAKCLHIARHMLGKKASANAVEDQALDLMDLPDRQINTTLQRMAASFMACGEAPMGADGPTDDMAFGDDVMLDAPMMPAGPMGDLDDDLMMEPDGDLDDDLTMMGFRMAADEDEEEEEAEEETSASRKASLRRRAALLRWAAEEEEKEEVVDETDKEIKKACKTASNLGIRFASDGFLTKGEWNGPRRLFAAIDSDRDGIISVFDFLSYRRRQASDLTAADEGKSIEAMLATLYAADEEPAQAPEAAADEESNMLAMMLAEMEEEAGQNEAPQSTMPEMKTAAEEDEEEEEAPVAAKKGKKAKKADADEEVEEEEEEAPVASKSAKKAKKGGDEEEEVEVEEDEDEEEAPVAAKKGKKAKKADADEAAEEEEDEESSDKAASYDNSLDPMGLTAGVRMSKKDASLLEEIFGTKTAKNADADEEDEEEEEVSAEEEEEEEAKGVTAGEEEEEEEDEEEEEEAPVASKKASVQRPRMPKQASGVKTLGSVVKTAGKNVSELSQLWESAPDVSDVFGMKRSR